MPHITPTRPVCRASRSLPAVLLVAGLVLCLGCAAPQVRPSGFLSDYNSLQLSQADSSVYLADPPTSSGAKTHVILLHDTQLVSDGDMDTSLSLEMARFFTTRLRLRMIEQVKGSVFVLDKESEAAPYWRMPGVGIMTLDCALTHVGTGFGPARYLVGFGLGDAGVTVEARATLAARGMHETHEAVVFAHSTGNPYGGLNPRVLSARYCLRLACDAAADKLARVIAQRMAPPPPNWWERRL